MLIIHVQVRVAASVASLLQSSCLTSSATWSSWRRYTCPGIWEDTDRTDAGRTGRRSSARNRSRTVPYLQQHDFNFTTRINHIFHSFLRSSVYFSPQTAYPIYRTDYGGLSGCLLNFSAYLLLYIQVVLF